MARDTYEYQKSYDIVNQYDWTSVARNSDMRNEAPSVYVTAYKLQYSQLRSFIDGYINILAPINKKGRGTSADPGLDFYRRLYGTTTSPITRLSFPFFTDNIRAFTSEFADTFSPVSQRGAKMLGGNLITGLGEFGESVLGGGAALASNIMNIGDKAGTNEGAKSVMDKISKTAQAGASTAFNQVFGTQLDFNKNPGMQTVGAPGTYIETPKFYQYSNTDTGLQISFALSNTLHNDSKDINHKFIKDFTRMNRPYRTGVIGMEFPAIYNIVLPGQRYIQWASLESFSVDMLGMRRRLPVAGGGSRVVPEGYSCQFNFRSLTIEAANFMDEIDKYGSFAGDDENSYAKLKAQEEKQMKEDKDAMDRANKARTTVRTPPKPIPRGPGQTTNYKVDGEWEWESQIPTGGVPQRLQPLRVRDPVTGEYVDQDPYAKGEPSFSLVTAAEMQMETSVADGTMTQEAANKIREELEQGTAWVVRTDDPGTVRLTGEGGEEVIIPGVPAEDIPPEGEGWMAPVSINLDPSFASADVWPPTSELQGRARWERLGWRQQSETERNIMDLITNPDSGSLPTPTPQPATPIGGDPSGSGFSFGAVNLARLTENSEGVSNNPSPSSINLAPDASAVDRVIEDHLHPDDPDPEIDWEAQPNRAEVLLESLRSQSPEDK